MIPHDQLFRLNATHFHPSGFVSDFSAIHPQPLLRLQPGEHLLHAHSSSKPISNQKPSAKCCLLLQLQLVS